MRRRPYRIEYSPLSREHLAGLTARERSAVLDTVDTQLTHEPRVVRPRIVEIRAVGRKDHNRVLIGGEEIDLS